MRYWAFALLAFAASVNAQTRTITAGGATVVVDITSVPDDNGDTVRTTSTIRTLGGNAPNPIADQPQSANPDEPTYYWVTSIDADGNTIVNSYIFTPTFAPTSDPVAYSPGTILEYSDFTASYATRTSYPNGAAPLLSKNSAISLTLTLGAALGGMLLVLA